METAFYVFLAQLVAGAAAAASARAIDPERKKLLTTLALASLAGIFTKLVFTTRQAEGLLDGSEIAFWLERDFALPFGMAFFGFAAPLLPDAKNRRAVSLMPFVLGATLVVSNAWTFTTPESWRKSDGIWSGGVICLQSTDFTCGPASVATVARKLGANVTEHEAARLTLTIPGKGSTNLGATRALRRLLPGRKVAIRWVSLDELASAPCPCLLPLAYSFWFDHMTVLLAADAKGFVIGDPLRGSVRYTRGQLAERYLGHVITVE